MPLDPHFFVTSPDGDRRIYQGDTHPDVIENTAAQLKAALGLEHVKAETGEKETRLLKGDKYNALYMILSPAELRSMVSPRYSSMPYIPTKEVIALKDAIMAVAKRQGLGKAIGQEIFDPLNPDAVRQSGLDQIMFIDPLKPAVGLYPAAAENEKFVEALGQDESIGDAVRALKQRLEAVKTGHAHKFTHSRPSASTPPVVGSHR